MFTGVFKDRSRVKPRASAHETLAQLLRAKSLRPHRFLRSSEVGPFIVEHVCQERLLIVELRPNAAMLEPRAKSRIEFLNEMGYTVLLVSRQRVLEQPDKVLAQVREALCAVR